MTNLQLQFKILNNIDWYKEVNLLNISLSINKYHLDENDRFFDFKQTISNGRNVEIGPCKIAFGE